MSRTHCCRHKCFPVCPRAQHLLRTQILVRMQTYGPMWPYPGAYNPASYAGYPSKEVSALYIVIFFHTCYFPSRDSSFVLLFRTSIWTRCVFCKRCSILTSFRSEPGKEGRNPWSPLHVPCQGPGRAVLYRL